MKFRALNENTLAVTGEQLLLKLFYSGSFAKNVLPCPCLIHELLQWARTFMQRNASFDNLTGVSMLLWFRQTSPKRTALPAVCFVSEILSFLCFLLLFIA